MEKFFSQIVKNIKKKDFIFSSKPSPKASLPRGAGKIILLHGAKQPKPRRLRLLNKTAVLAISRPHEMLYPHSATAKQGLKPWRKSISSKT
ncbi:MAG: hypothetical protein INF88_19800 [Roseomonas sp.]|nr:hypothetical protein [Roseomonas sp.]